MNKQLLNEKIESLKPQGDRILSVLDDVKDYIADARNGEWDVDARKAACEAIDEVIYNKLKLKIQEVPDVKPDTWL